MPSPTSRMRWLRAKLYSVRNGTGAAVLPPNISRIALSFNYKSNNGHMGPRKFFRECLPRLKYHNPEVDMIVTRKDALEGPATLTIHFSDVPVDNKLQFKKKQPTTPVVRETISTIDIDMLNRYPDDIMAELVQKTSATLYSEPPRPQELEEEAEYLAAKRENELKEKYKLQRADRRTGKEDQLKGAILA
ncbi:hypothetical protein TWF173_006636 [Orbilia oligospora]|uniref:Ribosomal protein/NADH dehydrogenase domain-containing protein n=2 Tax=Orbilia oligospora TaxID=2813651 RepID=G1XFQ9_ARTOA|nr:hypothetical protein AOL_s00081g202 [Orbilia oligospora ATCC 24927]EGX47875.1 hypothetical protein AOL_s00081g202 [Orbilia oligospora ATCC 24927]KAF3290953.1 hypothetical protein TWF970_000209 [Orbilia oligospora]KAF3318614.1 hypothetical protein TWF173_006636 [Orbilia oligospora]